MSKFELKSDFGPTGDQPAAIEQLTKGIESGLKHQTLLGVTGSGKSVTADTKVIVEHSGRLLSVPIGQFDTIFPNDLPNGVEATQIVLPGSELRTVTLSTNTGHVRSAPVAEISRHRYDGDLYTVATACGRINRFTDSHNVYALRAGELQLLPSQELRAGDYLPIPERLPEPPAGTIDYFDMREWLPEGDYYVADAGLRAEQLVASAMGREKRWRVLRNRERVGWADYKGMTAGVIPKTAHVGTIHIRAAVPLRLPANRALLRFTGLFIAEGHAARGYIVLSTADSSIEAEFRAGAAILERPLVKRASHRYDYQIGGKVVAALMGAWCGTHAATKHLPVFWPQCSNEQLAAILSGIFAGNGWVESNTVTLASMSRELVHDVQTALLRFGIHARVRQKRGHYLGRPHYSWQLSITGSHDLNAFQSQIGFGLQRKDEALVRLCSTLVRPNTNVDLFPLPIDLVKRCMAEYHLSQQTVAKSMGVSRSLVSMYLSGRRIPARHRVQKLFSFLLEKSLALQDGRAAQLQQLRGLASGYWSPIRTIETESASTIVYDFSVPGTQTFLAGSYFVHNTFTMANVIQNTQKPTLVLSHNKTLAAQLYGEFKHFFPDNAVHYFVSYFDYYQPEAYIPRSDTYIEKDSAINEEIDRLRHAATDALLSRRDVIIVASVSCIYGIGSPADYNDLSVSLQRGERRVRDKLLRQLTDIQYQRNDIDFHRGTFRVRGDVIDIFPAGEELAYRVELFGDEVERITQIDPLTGEILTHLDDYKIFPGSHYVTPQEKLKLALGKIEQELAGRLNQFKKEGKLLEAQRLEQRTRFDLEMLEQTGFVKGIENYSRYLTNREPGEQPATLLDYFPDDYLLLIDESHMSIPQVRGMYNGDRARKEVLVEHGFRLPSALDNRPLTFTEFERHVGQAIYVSATPAQYELSRSPEPVASQVIRPTGLLDPQIEVRPIDGQIDDLLAEIRDTIAKHQRVLVTTLTKRMSEDLTEYLQELGLKVAYLHSDVDTLDRTDILRDLRLGVYDVLVGINLLREGLDLPEVSLVAILDADKEGFLRSEQALIQTVGRAARHENGRVLMYADHVTDSMRRTIDETARRRDIQAAYNKEHGITPRGITRAVEKGMRPDLPEEAKRAKLDLKKIPKDEYGSLIKDLTSQMELAAANLQFETAAELRDLIDDIKKKL